MLHPDVVLRVDAGAQHPEASFAIRGAAAVAVQASRGAAAMPATLHPVLVNGSAGAVITMHGQAVAVMAFTIASGKIIEIDAITDPERARKIAAAVLNSVEAHATARAHYVPHGT